VQRIAVVGPVGAGKSSLAGELGRALGIRVLHLDTLFWKPGWIATPPDEWDAVQRRELAQPQWIADAQYDDILPDWVEQADTVVFLDVSTLVCLWRVGRRRLDREGSGATPAGTKPGAIHGALRKFVRNQWLYRTKVRRELLAELRRERPGRQVVVVRRSGDAEAFLRSVDSPRP
jgi:hypothetical protein